MLRKMLSTIGEDFWKNQSTSLLQNASGVFEEANKTIAQYPPLNDFFAVAKILIGQDVHIGAGVMIIFLRNSGKFTGWIERMLKALDRDFCLSSADLLLKDGAGDDMGLNFTDKTQQMLETESPDLAAALSLLGFKFGVGFTAGAYLQLELFRRLEEKDFGVEPEGRLIQ